MDIGAVIFGAVIFGAVVPYVFGPVVRPAGKNKAAPAVSRPDHLFERQAVMLSLRDLDFDFRTGKVAEDDYQSLRTALLAMAASLPSGPDPEDEALEALIQARRKALAKSQGAKAAAGLAVCPACGAGLAPCDRFCVACGAVQPACCSNCGAGLAAGAHFCSRCGAAVADPAKTQ